VAGQQCASHRYQYEYARSIVCDAGSGSGVIAVPGGLANFSANTVTVICGVTRSPVVLGATGTGVYVDVLNEGLGTVACTVQTVNYNATAGFLSSFTASTRSIDQYVAIPSAQLHIYYYLDVACQLPPGAVMIGVTAVQP
jgi:hypothetical protein